MNSSTAATLPLLQTSSKNLRTSFLLFSWVSDTGASPLSQPTLLYRIDTMHIRPPGGVTRIDGGLFTQVRGRGILGSSHSTMLGSIMGMVERDIPLRATSGRKEACCVREGE